jgi:hypothetical protein
MEDDKILEEEDELIYMADRETGPRLSIPV